MSKERQPVTCLVISNWEEFSWHWHLIEDTEDNDDSSNDYDDDESESLQRVCSLVICQTINDLSHTAESVTIAIILFLHQKGRLWKLKKLLSITDSVMPKWQVDDDYHLRMKL